MWKKIHPDISLSEKLSSLGFNPCVLWMFLLPHTDTKGRYSADPRLIKSQVLPYFHDVRLEQVESALKALAAEGLIHLYDAAGKKYLVYHDHEDWSPSGGLKYQKSKWPAPLAVPCKCVSSKMEDPTSTLSRRDNVVSLSPSLSHAPEGVQGEGPYTEPPPRPPAKHGSYDDDWIGRMLALCDGKAIPTHPNTNRKWIKAMEARVGKAETEALLRNAPQGLPITEIYDRRFGKGEGKGGDFKRDDFPKLGEA